MSEQIIKIGVYLKEGAITEVEARNALCKLLNIKPEREILFNFCTFLEETTNIKPFIYKDRIVNSFINRNI